MDQSAKALFPQLAIMPLRFFCLGFSLQSGRSPKKSPELGPKSFKNAVPVLWPDSGRKTGTALSSVINAVPILWPESGHENGTTNTNKIGTRIGLGAARTHPKTEKQMRTDRNLLAQCPCWCNATGCGNKRVSRLLCLTCFGYPAELTKSCKSFAEVCVCVRKLVTGAPS